MKKRLAILASYCANEDLDPYLIYHVQKLRDVCDDVWFISNSPISEKGRAELAPHCSIVQERPNVGYDFSAWRDAILGNDIAPYDEVILTNSSVIGPLFGLSGVFAEMYKRSCDFWGMTMNRAKGLHIQSYFICFRKSITSSDAWTAYWNSIKDETEKWNVILKYEVKLMRYFEGQGFIGDSFIPIVTNKGIKRIKIRRLLRNFPVYIPIDSNRTNPTIHSPYEIISEGMPYLKASLVWGHNQRQPFPLEKIKALPNVDFDWSLADF